VREVTDLGKGAVAVVVEQPAWGGIVNARNAVIAIARLAVAAKLVLGLVKVNEAANKEVQPAVVVMVKPNGARCPAGRRQAGLLSDICEGAVPVVVIENAAAILRHVEVGETVAIVVAHCRAHAVAAGRHAGFLGYVREGAIAV